MSSLKQLAGFQFLRRYFWLMLGVGLFAFIASTISWAETLLAFRRLTVGAIAVLIVANVAALLPMFGRWWAILQGQNYAVPFWSVARYALSGFAISYVTPGPQFGGEPYQVIQLQRRHDVPLASATASVTIEKMLMLLTNLIFLVPGIILVLQDQLFATADLLWGILPGGVFLALLALLLAGWVGGRTPLSRVVGRFSWATSIQQAEAEIARFCVSHPRALALAGFWSVLNWMLLAAEYLLMARFLGIDLSLTQGFIMLTVFRLALLMPIPGGLGAVEGGHVWILQAMGIESGAELGLSLSLLIRLRDFMLALLGLWLAGGKVRSEK